MPHCRRFPLDHVARPLQVRGDHACYRRHRGIDGRALPRFSVLIFHPEFKVEQQFVPTDKLFGGLPRIIHTQSLVRQKEQIKNSRWGDDFDPLSVRHPPYRSRAAIVTSTARRPPPATLKIMEVR